VTWMIILEIVFKTFLLYILNNFLHFNYQNMCINASRALFKKKTKRIWSELNSESLGPTFHSKSIDCNAIL